MTTVAFGLLSVEENREGHLIRGVQMLRSQDLLELTEVTDVVNVSSKDTAPPALCAVARGKTSATPEQLREMIKETEWALGADRNTLRVELLQFGHDAATDVAPEMHALNAGNLGAGMGVYMQAEEFAKHCGWGDQGLTGEFEDVAGEQPSATARG